MDNSKAITTPEHRVRSLKSVILGSIDTINSSIEIFTLLEMADIERIIFTVRGDRQKDRQLAVSAARGTEDISTKFDAIAHRDVVIIFDVQIQVVVIPVRGIEGWELGFRTNGRPPYTQGIDLLKDLVVLLSAWIYHGDCNLSAAMFVLAKLLFTRSFPLNGGALSSVVLIGCIGSRPDLS